MEKYIFISKNGDSFTDFKVGLKHGFFLEDYEKELNVSEDAWEAKDDCSDILYFYPGCTVPRFKVKEHFKATLKPETASAVFIPAEGNFPFKTDKNMAVCKTVEMKVTDFLGYIKANYTKQDRRWDKLHMLAHMNSFTTCYIDASFVVANYYHGPNDATATKTALDQWLNGSRWGYSSFSGEDCKAMVFIPMNSKLNNITCPIYYETDLLKHLNKDALVIDEKKYNEMTAFGESDDDENIVLMMELMANCDFEKSYVYLLMLLKAYGNKMAYQPVINHVNFRSLLKYFNLERKEIGDIDLLKLTEALKATKKFTRSNVQIIQSLCSHDYIRYENSGIGKYYTEGPCLRPEFNNFNDV